MNRIVRQIPLENGLTVSFSDVTRRYFGDYHQVRVEIRCEVPVLAELFEDAADFEKALKVLGGKVSYLKLVEHQGVPTEATEATVRRVIQQFIDHSLAYFASPLFPRRLVHSELSRARSRTRFFVPGRSHA